MTGLIDKNGIDIQDNSIIYGKHEGVYRFFNIGVNDKKEIEMIACTYGYVHNVTQKDIEGFLLIGSVKENKHLLECD